MIETSIAERVIEMAMQIQQISSPTFGELQRAEFMRGRFRSLGLKGARLDECGNVLARLEGRGKNPPVVLTAHLDTVFPAGTDLAYRREEERISGPGIGDNSLGLAALFGVYWQLTEHRAGGKTGLPGDVWLAANVGEEGLGDLRGMKAIVDRFGDRPAAYIVIEGMTLGQIYTRGLGVRRYRIEVHTEGGHSWTDYGKPSAIHEISGLIEKIKQLPVPHEPRTSLNVGVISGGTSVNTIAAKASLELDLRSESPSVLERLASQVEQVVQAANERGGRSIEVRVEVTGNRPAGEISREHPLVQTAIDCFSREGILVKLNIGSTDANIPLSRGYPAVCIGLTTGGGSHTLGEFIHTKPIRRGLNVLVDLVQALFRNNRRPE